MLSLILLLSGTLAVNCQAFLRVCVSQSFSDSDSSPGRYYYYYYCYYFSCSGWSLGSTTTGPSLCGKDVNDVKIFRRERHAQYTSFFSLSLSLPLPSLLSVPSRLLAGFQVRPVLPPPDFHSGFHPL